MTDQLPVRPFRDRDPVEALDRACLCPDPERFPDWRHKACPLHGRRAPR